MREIKFDVIVCMSKFSTIEHKTLQEAIDSEDVLVRGNTIIPQREVYIREYTGLNDKNGKEVFYKDILKDRLDRLLVVEWDEQEAKFYIKPLFTDTWIHSMSKLEHYEVIGNIYENKELI